MNNGGTMGQIRGLPALSKMAGASESTVRRWLQTGALQGVRDAMGVWTVDDEIFRGFLAQRTIPMIGSQPPSKGGSSTLDLEGPNGRLPLASHTRGATGLPQEPLPGESTLAVETLREALTAQREETKQWIVRYDQLNLRCETLNAEIRTLEAEMRAILKGALTDHPSRWVKAGPAQEQQKEEPTEKKVSENTKEIEGQIPEKPKGSPFALACLRLSEEGRSPEEIAKILGKPKQNVTMALRSLKPS